MDTPNPKTTEQWAADWLDAVADGASTMFAVLMGIQGGRQGGREGRQYLLADPSLRQRTVTREQLVSLWHGEALLVGPLSGGHASAGAP